MNKAENRLHLLLLPFALSGFALAQPVYHLLLQVPEFLVARQSTALEVQTMVAVLSIAVPLALALPGWLIWKRWPVVASLWCWVICSGFAALFFAQLLKPGLGEHWLLYLMLSLVSGSIFARLLLYSRWSMLGTVLAAIALAFPLWFLISFPSPAQLASFSKVPPKRLRHQQPLPNIVFIILDGLPLATLLDESGQVDETLFPGFARLQSISSWYFNTTSASDGTIDAVPTILTGRYPVVESTRLIYEMHPDSLFTYLHHDYQLNVAESVSRLCPQVLCPRSGPGPYIRTMALLLDIAAVYLHRVVPQHWASTLPEVTSNWSGFFAARQAFFPRHWRDSKKEKNTPDWPGVIRRFTESILNTNQPTLNFLHAIFPHGPYAYLPNGENYGRVWMRGADKNRWGDVQWGITSGMQRHYLQVQYADHLVNDLLDHLQYLVFEVRLVRLFSLDLVL